MTIIFFGTSEFAVSILEAFVKMANFNIEAVITSPDEPVGRKKVLTPPPIKSVAKKYGVKIFQPKKLRKNEEFLKTLKNFNPDICIVTAYGKIIPREYLGIPKFGFVNVHPSFLPKYRGPTPIQTAILNGDEETGVTIIKMDEEIDHGPILANLKFKIQNSKYYTEISQELAELGAKLLIETLPNYVSGKIKPQPQDHSKATFTKKFTIEDGKINWSKPAQEIENKIQALNPEPGTYTNWENKKIKILRVKNNDDENKYSPGTVKIQNGQLLVKTANSWISVEKLQLEGRRGMDSKTFINGYRKIDGKVLN